MYDFVFCNETPELSSLSQAYRRLRAAVSESSLASTERSQIVQSLENARQAGADEQLRQAQLGLSCKVEVAQLRVEASRNPLAEAIQSMRKLLHELTLLSNGHWTTFQKNTLHVNFICAVAQLKRAIEVYVGLPEYHSEGGLMIESDYASAVNFVQATPEFPSPKYPWMEEWDLLLVCLATTAQVRAKFCFAYDPLQSDLYEKVSRRLRAAGWSVASQTNLYEKLSRGLQAAGLRVALPTDLPETAITGLEIEAPANFLSPVPAFNGK